MVDARRDDSAVIRITLLGTGGPRPDPERQGPATLVEVGALKLLFDAGRGVVTQLARIGVTLDDLDAVFVTHHHFDHIGGLGDLLMGAWNLGRSRKLPIHGPIGTAGIVAALLDTVYAADIRFRIREAEKNGEVLAHVACMIEVSEGSTTAFHLGSGVTVKVRSVEHGGAALDLDVHEWSAVGYRVESPAGAVALAGDAIAGQDLHELATDTEALVISCYLARDEIVTAADDFLTRAVLAGPAQLADIAARARTRRLVLTHFRRKSAALLASIVTDIAGSYDGEIVLGEDLTVVLCGDQQT